MPYLPLTWQRFEQTRSGCATETSPAVLLDDEVLFEPIAAARDFDRIIDQRQACVFRLYKNDIRPVSGIGPIAIERVAVLAMSKDLSSSMSSLTVLPRVIHDG